MPKITVNILDSTVNVAVPDEVVNVEIMTPVVRVGGGPIYTGDYEVTPLAWEDQTLETEGKEMLQNVTVFKVPKWDTANPSGGRTCYIACTVN